MAWDDVSRWQPVDLAAAFKMGDAVQPVDVRDRGYRESDSQVKGALRIDPMEFESQVGGLPDGKELIFSNKTAGRFPETRELREMLMARIEGAPRGRHAPPVEATD